MNSTNQEPDKPLLFGLGKLFVTRGIQALMDEQGLDVSPYIARHMTGDDGDLDEEDKAENHLSLIHGYRILSAYHFSPANDPDNKIKFWIITEADRAATTVLLPEEY